MLNFEEELKKFRPSMEIEDVEEAVRSHELTDMTDIMLEMLRRQKDNSMPNMGQAMSQVTAQAMAPAINNAINTAPGQAMNPNVNPGIIQ